MMGETFHFLRPEWLWGLIGLPLLFFLSQRRDRSAGGWRAVCDPELLSHLLHRDSATGRNWALPALVVGWLGAVLALAGPTWERLPEVAYHEPTQTVAVLQLTPSMHTSDIAPSRLERARYELQDLLEQSEGTVGLVIFAEEAYGVTPLTDDPKVIGEIVPTLDTNLMPGRGTRPDRGIAEAHQLLKNAGARSGRIILFIDAMGDAPQRTLIEAEKASDAGFPVSVLALGSEPEALRLLAEEGQGRFSPVLADDRDITALLSTGQAGPDAFQDLRESGLEADTWKDAGVYLIWIPLLLAPLAFRKGWAGALGVLLLLSTGSPQSAEAAVEDWFARPDQQGARAFDAGRHDEATEHFENPEWRGVAAYRSGQHETAIEVLSEIQEPRAQYNLGNALAQNGQYEEAIRAYDEVIEFDADHADALHNRELVAKLLEEQQQQDQQQQQDSQENQSSAQNENEQEESSSSPSDSQQGESKDSAQSDQAAESNETQGSEDQDEQGQGSDSQNASDPTQAQESASSSEGSSESQEPKDGPDSSDSDSQQMASDQNNQTREQQGADENPAENPSDLDQDQSASEMAQNGRSDVSPEDSPDQHETESERTDATGSENPNPTQEEASQEPSSAFAESGNSPMSEQEQEVEQWLSRVPDDPGGLLREKLRRRYAEKQGVARARQGGTTWQ
ncbi:MAG: tetratricopeptide repeat protein [Myxococcota bacterium]|nr:tetratricopeptide repeat protein [Myxococcota bacterium]